MTELDNALLYKTLLKLLDHDTRNTFVKLEALICDLNDSPIKDMIADSVHELYDVIASSAGFLEGKKRILSIYDIVSKLTLTSDKTNLTHHKRIHFTHDPKIYLFAEVSELFNHAVLNIIENALKYSPIEESVDVHIKRDVNHILIIIKDRGIGIDPDSKSRIFEQGYRSDEAKKYEGTGVGLWITKNIINKDSGTIEVSDNPSGGTIFTITVPIFFTENLEQSLDIVLGNYMNDPVELETSLNSVKTLIDLNSPPKEYHYDSLVFSNLLNFVRKEKRNRTNSHFKDRLEEIKSKNPGGKSIIIVDDSAYVHYYLGSFLCKLGYKVIGFAFNGEEGYNLYDKYRPDIITLDITMPVMSGYEASEKILEINPNAKMLFLSGLGDHKGIIDLVNKKLNGKEYGVLAKPFTIEKLKTELGRF